MLKLLMMMFLFSSCAHAPATKSIVVENGSVGPITGSVLDSDILAQGGSLALVPFKAGAQAEATDELDHISLMILKGIKDSVDEHKGTLQVVDAADGHPKLALQGYIKEFSKSGKLSRMLLKPNQYSLELEGELWLISNGQRLVNFSTSKKFNPKKEKPIDVAYALGREIGDFISDHAKQKGSL